jgi:hypothetical protein
MLPLDKTLADVHLRFGELVATLQIEEQRPASEIIEDLFTPNSDIVRVRLSSAAESDGTLPLEVGATMFQSVRDLLLAAACSAIAPRAVFARRKPDQAMSYLRNARIGQTARGSYVISVISPVAQPFIEALPGFEADSEDPFGRRVVRTLMRAANGLVAAAQVAAFAGRRNSAQQLVAHGVSANLCEALLGISGRVDDSTVDVSVAWAPTRPVLDDVSRTVRLPPELRPYLEETARVFRDQGELAGVEVVGVVRQLRRIDGSEGGRATIIGVVDGETRNVIADLDGRQHALAVKAYNERLTVSLEGTLVHRGREREIVNPRALAIIEDGDAPR